MESGRGNSAINTIDQINSTHTKAECRRTSVTTSLLQRFYHNVQNLKSYLLDILPGNQNQIISKIEDDACHELLNHAFVASQAKAARRLQVHPVNYDLEEVISQAQCQILKQNASSKNVLAIGYQWAGNGRNSNSLQNKFKNTTPMAFQSPEWKRLFSRIGVDVMLHLLTQVSIFLPLPNGCLCQVTGNSIIDIFPSPKAMPSEDSSQTVFSKRKHQDDEADARPYKKRKLAPGTKALIPNALIARIAPADLLFARTRLFYARPCTIPHTNHLVVGLPASHILTRIHPAYVGKRDPKAIYQDPDPWKQADRVRKLSKYIFPRQYGLATPFQYMSHKKESFFYPDYQDRDPEIVRLGCTKTPRGVKRALNLVDKLLWYHGKCAYKALRDLTCPSKIPTEDGRKVDSSVILELVSEESIILDTQPSLRLNDISIDCSGRPAVAFGVTQAKAHVRNKPRFVEFTCDYIEVLRYVALVTKAVIPMAFWGNQSNLNLVLKGVKRFITCRRFETISLHYVLQGFSTSACDWLAPTSEHTKQHRRIPLSDSLKRRELLEDFILWYFDGFVIPLLKTTFYITESSAFRNQILYFRQDDWRVLCSPLVERLVGNMFERIPDKDVKEILLQRSLGFSFVRLLPKETGVRPIVNLRKKKPITTGTYSADRSINQVLQIAFNILTYEKKSQSERLGASVFGSDEVYIKLKEFKARLPRNVDGSLPRLYFVKVDVQACFDSIEQTKLLEILRDLISEDQYISQRYGQVHFSTNKVKKHFLKRAVPGGDNTHFLKTAQDLAGALRNVIFVDQVKYPHQSKTALLQLLEEHITENMVKIGNHYYKQKVGIPQGSILSALLCSFFYGDLERRRMKFTQGFHSTLLRLIDDYLFITTSLSRAKEFLQMMTEGHPEYGCFISREKTLTNFDHGIELSNNVDPYSKSFPWCGYLINMRNLGVSVDYSRYGSWGIRNTMTIDRGRKPAAAFEQKMIVLGRSKNHIIYSDPKLNSEDTVCLNIYQNFFLTALKMQEYVREGGLKLARNIGFLYKTIQRCIESSYMSIMAQVSRKLKPLNSRRKLVHLKKATVLWLGNHAFLSVIRRKPHGYSALLRNLEKQMGRLGNNHYKRRFKHLVKEGQSAFVDCM